MKGDSSTPNIKILVACHKADPNIRNDELYMPIQVGKALHPNLDLGYQCDNTGENISEKNNTFCELTAIYWAWKNLKDLDYIGLCHYRRYFDLQNSSFRNIEFTDKDNFSLNKEFSILKNLLSQNRIIVAKDYIYPYNLYDQYAINHNGLDLRESYNIINQKYKNYKNPFEDCLFRNNKISLFNMFIMDWNTFNEYCNFIFPLLFDLEKKLNIDSYDSYQKRIYGFIGERLLNVFLFSEKSKKEIIKLPILTIINNSKQIPYHIYYLNYIRFSLAYHLGKSSQAINKLLIH